MFIASDGCHFFVEREFHVTIFRASRIALTRRAAIISHHRYRRLPLLSYFRRAGYFLASTLQPSYLSFGGTAISASSLVRRHGTLARRLFMPAIALYHFSLDATSHTTPKP